MKLLNIIRFAFSNPSNFGELNRKIVSRISKGGYKEEVDLNWINSNVIDFKQWGIKKDANLWEEANLFAERLENVASKKLKNIPFDLGGGGIYPIIYFLMVLKKPNVVVETGVAAGYSSQTFLSAIHKNRRGFLYSSDFPYFRIPNPKRYIGLLVEEELKSKWKLFTEGDTINLPKILNEIDSIDFFHYDSDKSYEGRTKAFNAVKRKLSKDALIVYDDIQDNNHFKDFVTESNLPFIIFQFEDKFVGATGSIDF